jgi:hypothetical protein
MFSGAPNAIIDFHSGGFVNNDFDTRITSYSGSNSTDPAVWNGKGLLELLGTTIQIAGELKMTEGKNITLAPATSYVAPSSGQLGSSATITGNVNSTVFGATTLRSASLSPGVWIITGNANMGASGSYAILCISATASLDGDSEVSTPDPNLYLNITRTVTLTTTTTYNLIAQTDLASTLSSVTFRAVRIA